MNSFFTYKGDSDEFGKFQVKDTIFTIITVPASTLDDEAEVIPTFDEHSVLIALPRERLEEAFPDDMPDMARGMAMGMIVGGCIALAERWLAAREDSRG
jgi:hypothetical protein